MFQLSVTAETTPGNVEIHTQQDLLNLDSDTTILDNSTLDTIPVLKNAIDQAFSKFTPHHFLIPIHLQPILVKARLTLY